MTHKELMTKLSLDIISEMPYNDLASLTDNFAEKDIRAILAKSDDIDIQRRVFASIKKKYIQWDEARDPMNFNIRGINKSMLGGSPTPDYPKYFDDISLSLKYNFLIEPKKEFSMPYIPASSLRQHIAGTETTETPDTSKYKALIKEQDTKIKQLQTEVKEKDAVIASLKQQLGQGEFHSTKSVEAILKEEIERQKQKREDMLVELLRTSFYVEDDARRFVKEIDNGMDSDGVAEVACRYCIGKKIIKDKRGRSLWKILHAAKLYDKVEQSWTRVMRKAD